MSGIKLTHGAIGEYAKRIMETLSTIEEFKFKPRNMKLGKLKIFIYMDDDGKVKFNTAECRLDCIHFNPSDFINFIYHAKLFKDDKYLDDKGKASLIWIITHEMCHLQQRFIYYTVDDDYRDEYINNMEYANEIMTFTILKKYSDNISKAFDIDMNELIPDLIQMASYLMVKPTDKTFYPAISYKQKLTDTISSFIAVDIMHLDHIPDVVLKIDGSDYLDELYFDFNDMSESDAKYYLQLISDNLFNDIIWKVRVVYIKDTNRVVIECTKKRKRKVDDGAAFIILMNLEKYENSNIITLASLREKTPGWEIYPSKDSINKTLKGGF